MHEHLTRKEDRAYVKQKQKNPKDLNERNVADLFIWNKHLFLSEDL